MREHEPARNFRREFVKQEHSDKNRNIGRDPSDSEWAEKGICLTITAHHYHYRFTIVASKLVSCLHRQPSSKTAL